MSSKIIKKIISIIVFLLGFQFCYADINSGNLATACIVADKMNKQGIYTVNEGYDAGFCKGILIGMIAAKFGHCGTTPGFFVRGFARAANRTQVELAASGKWWPDNPPSYIVAAVLNKVPVNDHNLCPLDIFLWKE
jgi:hypothetical protein